MHLKSNMPARIMISVVALLALRVAAAVAGVNEELLHAARLCNLPEVNRLIAEGAAVNAKTKEGGTPLIYVSSRSHREVVGALLDNGADGNARGKYGKTALMFASNAALIDASNREITQALLEKGDTDWIGSHVRASFSVSLERQDRAGGWGAGQTL